MLLPRVAICDQRLQPVPVPGRQLNRHFFAQHQNHEMGIFRFRQNTSTPISHFSIALIFLNKDLRAGRRTRWATGRAQLWNEVVRTGGGLVTPRERATFRTACREYGVVIEGGPAMDGSRLHSGK